MRDVGMRDVNNGESRLEALADLASRAGAAIMACRGASGERKADGSPVCAADRAAEAVILAGLSDLFPGTPIVSEESHTGTAPMPEGRFLLVDPLDGTKGFLAGSDEFTVNIALVEDGLPTLACLYAPALSRMWLAGDTARRFSVAPGASLTDAGNGEACRTRHAASGDTVALTSLSHSDVGDRALVERFGASAMRPGGSSLKFGLIADGVADVYPRCGPVMAWDIAAGHAVVAAAGGAVTDLSGQRIDYSTLGSNPLVPGFVAVGDRHLLSRLPAARTQ